MTRKRPLLKWLDIYHRLRKPTAPPPKPHRTKGYSKADRRRAKKEIGGDTDE